jgi:hypothetical protein
MRLLVCGSRTWTDYRRLRRTLEATVAQRQADSVTIIEGGARGADRMAGHLADLVVAFTVGPLAGSRGTADMVRRARAAGVPVQVITSQP